MRYYYEWAYRNNPSGVPQHNHMRQSLALSPLTVLLETNQALLTGTNLLLLVLLEPEVLGHLEHLPLLELPRLEVLILVGEVALGLVPGPADVSR